jgi:hypothetical protein
MSAPALAAPGVDEPTAAALAAHTSLMEVGAHELAEGAVVVDQRHGRVHCASYRLATANG